MQACNPSNGRQAAAQANSETIPFDSDFKNYIIKKSSSQSLNHNKRYAFYESLHKQLEIKDGGILSEQFIKKPGPGNLMAVYLDTKIRWGAFGLAETRTPAAEVIQLEMTDPPSAEEQLVYYYNTLFSHLQSFQSKQSFASTNFDSDRLGLSEKELTIVFLCAMRSLGTSIGRKSRNPSTSNCKQTQALVEKLPRFDGTTIDKYSLATFEDFNIIVN